MSNSMRPEEWRKGHPPTNATAAAGHGENGVPRMNVVQPFAYLSIHRKDCIRLSGFGHGDVNHIHNAMRTWWDQGVIHSKALGKYHEIKLRGKPWAHNNVGVDAPRLLMLNMLRRLYGMGWVLQTSINFIRDADDKAIPAPCRWLCVSFERLNKLKIVGEPPKDLCNAIEAGFKGVIRQLVTTQDRLKVKFHGTPWEPSGDSEGADSRWAMITLLRILEQYGFTPYTSINIHQVMDTDILIVTRPFNWESDGLPVWRR